jgi:uncharacterized OB-fold protein
VYSITIARSGIETPYISAVVDLRRRHGEGNLIGIDPDPKKIKMGMPVEVVQDRTRKDREGNGTSHYFQPAKA